MAKKTTSGPKAGHANSDPMARGSRVGALDVHQAVFSRARPEDVGDLTKEQQPEIAEQLLEFCAKRQPAEILVDVRTGSVLGRHTATLLIASDDKPFLVSSVLGALRRANLGVRTLLHPVVPVQRDSVGAMVAVTAPAHGKNPAQDSSAESWMLIVLDAPLERPEERCNLQKELRAVIENVGRVVSDWQPMRARLQEVIDGWQGKEAHLSSAHLPEAQAFLRWLMDEHFTFLGARLFVRQPGQNALTIVPGRGLGLLQDDGELMFDGLRTLSEQPPEAQVFIRDTELLVLVSKTRKVSPVHRAVPMDAVFVKSFDDSGTVTGLSMFVGLFTSSAYHAEVASIPLLRHKATDMMQRFGVDPRGHDGRRIMNVLDNFPRDELFQIGRVDLFQTISGILAIQDRERLGLFVRRDPFARFFACLIFVPRDQFNTKLREKMLARLMDAMGGDSVDYQVRFEDNSLVQVYAIIYTGARDALQPDVALLEAELANLARGWGDRLRESLHAEHGDGLATQMLRRYAEAFPTTYRERYSPEQAVTDIAMLENIARTHHTGIDLQSMSRGAEKVVLRLYQARTALVLSEILPTLEHMGLQVLSAHGPYEITPLEQATPLFLHAYPSRVPALGAADWLERKALFEETLSQVCAGRLHSGPLNKLSLLAGLTWREITLLRAMSHYLWQVPCPFSVASIDAALTQNLDVTGLIVRYFHTRFHPDAGVREDQTLVQDALEHALEKVENRDDDRILRLFINLVESCLRTNFYQRQLDGSPRPVLSLKFDSRKVSDLPEPRPAFEIFVYSPEVEGVHLRGGKVARGGIRHSDRKDDYRVEILSLMKAQMVKNSVIVPVGAKGGFVIRAPRPTGEEVKECYRNFVRGLLDITDNRKGPRIVPPRDVVRHDEDDPYLVVAADKGTAHFSDIANAVAAEYDFWLGDAFASGGSVGYDHKKIGITARGAWEAVKRHFREMDHDIQAQDFTVVGVGDMAGDVFGNGMLLSRHICLLGAFNHKHIFCDPAPDPKTSYAERKRLFELPGSQWTDYDAAQLSKGGAIYPRDAKRITLTPEIQQLFELEQRDVTPADLVRAMLRAPVDLLWLGGIGTYIKAAEEKTAEVGDRANADWRVDAEEVRARVIGEGANLGVTQLGRIAFALKGGRINTDAIDNSGGVDTSDHEVNIKILLAGAVASGRLKPDARKTLLHSMTEDVARLVLRSNYKQTLALSLAQARGAENLPLDMRLLRLLTREAALKREVEFLPDDAEMQERVAAGHNLTRPERAVIMAYAKIALYQRLLQSSLPDETQWQDILLGYFPTALHEEYRSDILQHELRREIWSTRMANMVINRCGISFVLKLTERTGRTVTDVVRGFLLARAIYDFPSLWREIEALDSTVAAREQTALLLQVQDALEEMVVLMLQAAARPQDWTPAEIAAQQHVVSELSQWLQDSNVLQLPDSSGATPPALLWRVQTLPALGAVPLIAQMARALRQPVKAAAEVYYATETRFGLASLRQLLRRAAPADIWQRELVAGLAADLAQLQRDLLGQILENGGLTAWLETYERRAAAADRLLQEIRQMTAPDVAIIAVMVRHLRQILLPVREIAPTLGG